MSVYSIGIDSFLSELDKLWTNVYFTAIVVFQIHKSKDPSGKYNKTKTIKISLKAAILLNPKDTSVSFLLIWPESRAQSPKLKKFIYWRELSLCWFDNGRK